MKLKKIGLAALALATVVTLAACGGNNTGDGTGSGTGSGSGSGAGEIPAGYTALTNPHPNGKIDAEGYYTVGNQKIKTKDTYKLTYTTEMSDEKFDYYRNTWQYNSLQYVNMVDGLIQNNQYGELYGGLATSYKTEDLADGKQKWTFKLRQGVKWINNATGEEVAEVKADDFVAGIEYVLDPAVGSELEYLVEVLDGAAEYYASLDDDEIEDKPFSSVGIKAIDDYTLEYTLPEVTPYFLTCLTYGCFYPVNRNYLDTQGTLFGTSENNILVNGAFRMTKHEDSSKIELTKNNKYYDAEHVYVNKVEQTFVSRQADISQARLLYENGTIDGFTVQGSDTVGFNKYVLGTEGTGTQANPADPSCTSVQSLDTFGFFSYFNYNRKSFEASSKTDKQKEDSLKAVLNKNFRLGWLYGLDILRYLQFYNPTDPIQRLNRVYTAKELAITSTGKDYVDLVEDVYNKKQGTTGVRLMGVDIEGAVADKKDPIYDATKAASFFDTAKTELQAAGASFPIVIDVIGSMDIKQAAYEEAMYKSIEENSNGLVDIQIHVPATDAQDTAWTRNANYDFSMQMGWGADYGDPKSFLHTIVEGEGDCLVYFGLAGKLSDEAKANMHAVFGHYTELYNEAVSITDQSRYDERLQKFAEAEYCAIYEDAIILPWYTRSGLYATVSKVIPHTASKAAYGNNVDKFLNLIVSADPITKDIRNAVNETYEAGKNK